MAANTWSVEAVTSGEGPRPVQKAPHSPPMPLSVMTGEPTASSRMGLAAICAAVLCTALGIAPPALAGPVDSLRQSLFGSRPSEGRQFAAPPIARYVSEDGDVFTLDRTQPKPLLKFDNSFEV